MTNNTNGYKESGQNIVQYAIEEQKIPFATVAKSGAAVQEVKGWISDYRGAQGLSISTGALGVLGIVSSVATIGPATFLAGAAGVVAIGGFVASYIHSRGVKTNQTELELLRLHPEILESLAHAVASGLPSGVAVSVYTQCLARHSTNRPINAATYKEMLAGATNESIARWKTSQLTSEAFVAGQEIEIWDEGDDDDYGEAPVAIAPATDEHLPAFLRSAAPATTTAQSPKSSGVAVQTSPIAAPTQTAILPRVQAPLLTRITKVGGFLPSRLFIGASRTGKSQVASDALSQVRTEYPDASIYYLSAGFKEAEDGWYWAAANHVAGYALKDMKPEAVRGAYEHWASLIEAFRDNTDYSSTKPKVLVVDELDSIMAFADGAGNSGKHVVTLLINTLTAASSTGAKDGFIMWALAPVGDCAGLGLTRGKVSAMNPVFVAFNGQEWNEATYKTAAANGLAPATRPQGFREGDRVIGIGGNWELLPPSPKLAQSINDCRFYPPSGMDLVMDAIAVQTMAQITEPEPVDELTQQMRAVYEYAEKRGVPVNKRGIRQATLPTLDGLNTDDIGTILELMAEDGYLHFQEDAYTVNPNKKP
jgi:hypothetical protein